jgi:Rrf2 family protein
VISLPSKPFDFHNPVNYPPHTSGIEIVNGTAAVTFGAEVKTANDQRQKPNFSGGVMFQLSSGGEYAVRTMLHLASAPTGEGIQISSIAAAWDIPENFLRKIVPLLSKASLIVSRRGKTGALFLARPAETITLLDVIQAVEGPMALNKCLIRPDFCNRSRWCAVHCLWSEAQETLKATLRSKSIAELAAASVAARRQTDRTHPLQAVPMRDFTSSVRYAG